MPPVVACTPNSTEDSTSARLTLSTVANHGSSSKFGIGVLVMTGQPSNESGLSELSNQNSFLTVVEVGSEIRHQVGHGLDEDACNAHATISMQVVKIWALTLCGTR